MGGTAPSNKGYGFEGLGGPVTEDGPHVTVTYFAPPDREHVGYADLTIDGGRDNFATVNMTVAECKLLRNALSSAIRRMT